MNPVESRCLYVGNLLVGGTGLLLLWVKTFYQAPIPEDPVDVMLSHPWQAAVQHLHIWAAPLLVLGIGMVWHPHAIAHWRGGIQRGRRSGLSLLALAAPMVISGYAITTSVSSFARNIWIWIHLGTSGLWLITFLAHIFWRIRKKNDNSGIRQNFAHNRR